MSNQSTYHTCIQLSFLQLPFAGIYIPESSHYYYPNFRTQGRFPAEKKSVLEKLDTIREIDEEERSTVRQRMSRDTGYTGLSILHRLYPLYGFLYDESTVYDEMHTISLNVVKNALSDLRVDSTNGIDWSKVDDRLNQIPWPSGMFIPNVHSFCFGLKQNLLPVYNIWFTLCMRIM